MDEATYMQQGVARIRPPSGAAPAPFKTGTRPALKDPLCAACKHGMTTKADDESRPVYYCLLAGVEMVRDVQQCTRYAAAEAK